MKMKELIKKILKAIYLDKIAIKSIKIVTLVRRKITRIDQNIINNYFNNTQIRKLHIGCGNNYLDGWLNSDYLPESMEILFLDATAPFPFNNDEFDYIFSEHMIEHVSYQSGYQMLCECLRVLKPKGKLRISTPDLAFLIDLYKSEKSELQIAFIKHSTDLHDLQKKYAPYYEDTFVINNYFRAWGHQFIYDEKALSYLFNEIGFINIARFSVCESRDEALQNLENVSRKPTGMIGLESLVLEGMKQ
jgi:predicted SAM-dependent methyltransferase